MLHLTYVSPVLGRVIIRVLKKNFSKLSIKTLSKSFLKSNIDSKHLKIEWMQIFVILLLRMSISRHSNIEFVLYRGY